MPTNFPTSVDVLVNPTPTDSLNAPAHSTQHTNANDAIEAIENYILNGTGAAWKSWTPVFSQPGVIAGGTINAGYIQIGKTIIARCDYTFTNVGVSGAITCNLPVSAKSAGTYTVGSFNFFDSGTNFYNGVCRLASATSVLSFFNGGTVGNTLGNSPTFTAAVGDSINFLITYEAA
jgi:hypothetical protein